MRIIKLTVDLEAATKQEMIVKLQDLIWEVKTLDTKILTGRDRGVWRRLTDLERAELAREYVQLWDAGTIDIKQVLADAHGWTKTFATDCLTRLRGYGYLTPASEPPALTEKSKREILLAEHAGRHVTES